MNILLIFLLSVFGSIVIADPVSKIKRCTITMTHTVKNARKYSVSYVTTTTTLTQASGIYTVTEYALPLTITVTRPEAFTTSIITVTEKITTGKVITYSTVTVTNTDATAVYVSTVYLTSASATSTILLETSDSPNNFKILTGLQLTLLLIGSFIFFI